jgi:hypothetical protein
LAWSPAARSCEAATTPVRWPSRWCDVGGSQPENLYRKKLAQNMSAAISGRVPRNTRKNKNRSPLRNPRLLIAYHGIETIAKRPTKNPKS